LHIYNIYSIHILCSILEDNPIIFDDFLSQIIVGKSYIIRSYSRPIPAWKIPQCPLCEVQEMPERVSELLPGSRSPEKNEGGKGIVGQDGGKKEGGKRER
jgi:hypothetical protein